MSHLHIVSSGGGGGPHAVEPPSDLRQLLDRLERALEQGPSKPDTMGSPALDLATSLIRTHLQLVHGEATPPGQLTPRRLRRVRERMLEDLSSDVTLAEMAEASGLSEGHFCRTFRRTTGVTPQRYRLQQKVEAAKEMLLTTQANLVDIALACGFADQPHMTTVFKRALGVTPKQVRVRAAA